VTNAWNLLIKGVGLYVIDRSRVRRPAVRCRVNRPTQMCDRERLGAGKQLRYVTMQLTH